MTRASSEEPSWEEPPAIADLGVVVDDGVGKDIEAGRAGEQEGPPPPVVVLPTQLEVGHHYGNLGAGDDEDHKHEEEEAKQVVELVLPDGLVGGRCVCVGGGGGEVCGGGGGRCVWEEEVCVWEVCVWEEEVRIWGERILRYHNSNRPVQ